LEKFFPFQIFKFQPPTHSDVSGVFVCAAGGNHPCPRQEKYLEKIEKKYLEKLANKT
jgi:hypothetical protein